MDILWQQRTVLHIKICQCYSDFCRNLSASCTTDNVCFQWGKSSFQGSLCHEYRQIKNTQRMVCCLVMVCHQHVSPFWGWGSMALPAHLINIMFRTTWDRGDSLLCYPLSNHHMMFIGYPHRPLTGAIIQLFIFIRHFSTHFSWKDYHVIRWDLRNR